MPGRHRNRPTSFTARHLLRIFTNNLSRTEQLLMVGYFFSLIPIERGDSPRSVLLNLLNLIPSFSKVQDFFKTFPTSLISMERDVAVALKLLPLPQKISTDEFNIRLLTLAFQNATLDLQDLVQRNQDLERVVAFLQGRIGEQETQIAQILGEPAEVVELVREVVVEVPVFVEKIVEVVVPGSPDRICEEARDQAEQEVEDLLQEKEQWELIRQALIEFCTTVRDILVGTISTYREFEEFERRQRKEYLELPMSAFEDRAAFITSLLITGGTGG